MGLTSSDRKVSKQLACFLKEIMYVIPNSFFWPRGRFGLGTICSQAAEHGFTDVVVFQEKLNKIYGVFISHLPDGPTTWWRMTRLTLGQHLKRHATCNPDDNPELILNNFKSRLGRRVARQLAALFPARPDFKGRRTITFHNQRDFIFFRHYRYMFRDDGQTTRCRLQEIGPRFTWKLRFMHLGTFDQKKADYEFMWRPDLQVSRKRFFM